MIGPAYLGNCLKCMRFVNLPLILNSIYFDSIEQSIVSNLCTVLTQPSVVPYNALLSVSAIGA